MVNFIASFIATIVMVPVFGIFIIYWLSRVLIKDKKRSVHLSVDFSTLIFIVAVHYLLIVIWGKSFLWIILLILILVAMVFVFLQWRFNQEIIFKKVWKGFWRLNFLLFSFGYFFLVIYGLAIRLKDL